MDYEDVGDIPMMSSPAQRTGKHRHDDVDDVPPPPPPSGPAPPTPDSRLSATGDDEGPPPPPPPGPPPANYDADKAAADRGMGGSPSRPSSSTIGRSKFAGTGRFARSVGLGNARKGDDYSADERPPPPPTSPPPPPPPPQDASMSFASAASSAASYYEDVGDIPMMSHRLPPPPPPPADAVGGPARPAPGAAGAQLGDVDDRTGVPTGPIAASPGQASLARDEAAREEAANAAAAAAAKKRGGIAKGIGKKLFGADGGGKDANKDADKDKKEDEDRENEYVSPSFGLDGAGAGAGEGRPPLPPAQSDDEPGATPLRNLGGDMDFERKGKEQEKKEEEEDDDQEPAGIRPADSKEEFLRKADDLARQSEAVFSGGKEAASAEDGFLRMADDLQRQSEAVFSGGKEAAAAPPAKKVMDAAAAPSFVGTSVAVPHDATSNDMDASSLSQTAILNDQQLRSALEARDAAAPPAPAAAAPLAPMPKNDEDDDDEEEDDDDNEEAAKEEADANSTSPDQSTDDMMSDILGVTMPDDIEETVEDGDDDAAPEDEESGDEESEDEEKDELMGEEKENENESDSEMEKTEVEQTDSLAAEEDKFNDIPPPSPKPVAAKESTDPQVQASEKPIDDALRRADEALAAAKLLTSPLADEPKPEDEDRPTQTDSAAVSPVVAPAVDDQEIDDSQKVEQDRLEEGPIQPSDSAEDQLDDDMRKVAEDLAAAGIGNSDKDEAADADADAGTDGATDADAAAVEGTILSVPSGATAEIAPKDEAENEAGGKDGDEIPATPEVSVDDVALEAVRLSAIDDEVSPIKAARGEDGDISRTSGGSAVNLDLSGPGGDGAWESDEKADKVPSSEPKTLQEKTEAAVAAASAAIAASRIPQGNVGEEDPPAISLSLTDESLDDRKKRAADLEASAQASRRSPKSQSSRFSKKKKKATWRAVVDEASGDVYYYNRKTRETTWDKPEGVEIDDRKRTFPDESGVTTVASEEVVAAEESTETIPLEGVTSDLTDNDGAKAKDADKSQEQVNGDHQDTADDDGEDPESEAEHEEDQASGGGKWKAVVDKASGQTYYYHTVTQETTWDKPAGYVEKKGMVKRGRQAAGALGGLIRRSTKHVIGGKATSKEEDKHEHPTDAADDAGTDTMPGRNAKISNSDKDDVVNFRNRYEVKDAETREAEAKKRGKALKFLRLKSAKASSGEVVGKKKEGSENPGAANSPDPRSQNQADISSDVDADGYSGMDTSDEGDHIQAAADFSVAAMDTPDKVKLPKSATKGRFVPSLGSPSEKDELNISDGSADKDKEGEAADNSNRSSANKGENPNQLWRAIIDANTLNTYYYNVRTKETTWDKPEGFQDVSKDELSASLE